MSRSIISCFVVLLVLAPAFTWSQEPEITVKLPGGVPLEMVWIEPGTFLMGGEPDLIRQNSLHGPQHHVTLTKGFYIGKFELTQTQWTAVIKTKPWEDREEDCPNCPVTWVSWVNSKLFLEQLNRMTDDSIFYRLPTEAEWEYTARAGTSTAWFFGDDESNLSDYGWYRENACRGDCVLLEVGLKLPNAWGIFDMHGNVWEFVEDWFDRYPEDPQVDPVTLIKNPDIEFSERVIRSGSLALPARTTRSGIRSGKLPNEIRPDVGFRVVGSPNITTPIAPNSWGKIKEGARP